jgi:AcrR family transcriptional regulator
VATTAERGRARTTRRADASKRLDAEVIIEAGLRLGSAPHAESISVRALGAELNADPTAIYRHFRSKEDLMRGLLDALHVRVLDRLTYPDAWQERLVELADVTLQVHVEHAAIAMEAVTLTTGGPGEARTIEYILGAFSDAGLADADVVQHYALLGSYMLSRTASIARSRSARDDTRDRTAWIDAPLLIDPVRQPHATALAARLSELEDDEIYRLGIRSIIQSAQDAADRGVGEDRS